MSINDVGMAAFTTDNAAKKRADTASRTAFIVGRLIRASMREAKLSTIWCCSYKLGFQTTHEKKAGPMNPWGPMKKDTAI